MVSDFITAVTSIERIHEVLASKDRDLLEELLREEEDELRSEFGDNMSESESEEFVQLLREKRIQLEQLLTSDTPASVEPGSTMYAIQRIVEREGLEVELSLDFNLGYQHIAWEHYRETVRDFISVNALELIGHLEGRPFRGDEIEFDGQVYGWLTKSEITELYDELKCVDPKQSTFVGPNAANGISRFHSHLLDALHQLGSRQLDCINVAC